LPAPLPAIELMPAQHEGYLSLLQLESLLGNPVSNLAQEQSSASFRYLGSAVSRAPPKVGERQFVVGLHLLRICLDLLLGRRDALLCGSLFLNGRLAGLAIGLLIGCPTACWATPRPEKETPRSE
jgi:hypothetical protein